MEEFIALVAWQFLVKTAQAICDGEPVKGFQKVDKWLLSKAGISPKIRETIVTELCGVIGAGKKHTDSAHLASLGAYNSKYNTPKSK